MTTMTTVAALSSGLPAEANAPLCVHDAGRGLAARGGAGLVGLPPELLVRIMLELDWRSVLRLQLVDTKLDEIVKTHVAVQYHIELGIAGKVNGPPTPSNPLTSIDRLNRLRLYQSRWRHFNFQHVQTIRHTGSIWELAHGVLAQGVAASATEHTGRVGVRKLFFTKLPSNSRVESKTREWTHKYYDEFAIRDFTMDPMQDLLVLIRESNGGNGNGNDDDTHSNSNTAELYLRSLKTNAKHTGAKLGVLTHALHGGTRPRSHSLQICQDRLAVMHKARAGHWPEKLVVYDWRKGKLLFEISFCGIMSFAFLSPQHLLFAVQPFNVMPACQGDHQPRFIICDIDQTAALSATGHPNSYAAICEFHLPELKQYADVVDIVIRSDSAPNPCLGFGTKSAACGSCYQPNGVLPAPAFETAPEDRLFVITMEVETVFDDMGDHRASTNITLALFVPLSTFLPFMFPDPDNRREAEIIPANSDDESLFYGDDFQCRSSPRRVAVSWKDWMQEDASGKGKGVRVMLTPGMGEDGVWMCNVSGMRCAFALEMRDMLVPLAQRHVAILDFGDEAVRRDVWRARCKVESDSVKTNSEVGRTEATSADNNEIGNVNMDESRAIIQDHLEPSTIETSRCMIFEEDVTTSLPYRKTVLKEKVRFHGVMMTDDNVIFVNQRAPREYRVLTF